jgi:hypothetical protein
MDIFQQTDHRPWRLPTAPWVMWQQWHELLFMHWALPPEVLRPLIPEEIELETFEGQAWLGVVPFRMSGVRARMMPALPRISAFPELNVRTYVKVQGKPGVFFFSLEAAEPLAVWAARRFFYLPYYNAQMICRVTSAKLGRIEYRSHRSHQSAPPAVFEGTYQPAGEVYRSQEGSLEHWLTSRYCLYTTNQRGEVLRGEIHHAPWDLQPAEAEIRVNTMAASHGIRLPDTPPLLLYSHCIEVAIWGLQKVT